MLLIDTYYIKHFYNCLVENAGDRRKGPFSQAGRNISSKGLFSRNLSLIQAALQPWSGSIITSFWDFQSSPQLMWDNLITHALYQQYPVPFFFSSCNIFTLLCSCPLLSRYFIRFADSHVFLSCSLYGVLLSSYWSHLETQQLSSWLFGAHGVRSHKRVANPHHRFASPFGWELEGGK